MDLADQEAAGAEGIGGVGDAGQVEDAAGGVAGEVEADDRVLLEGGVGAVDGKAVAEGAVDCDAVGVVGADSFIICFGLRLVIIDTNRRAFGQRLCQFEWTRG